MEVSGGPGRCPKTGGPVLVGDGVSMACSPAPGSSPRHQNDNHVSSHLHEVSKCGEEMCEQAAHCNAAHHKH